jgi:predicted lipoprotein with Yx(FWY)xxD motif
VKPSNVASSVLFAAVLIAAGCGGSSSSKSSSSSTPASSAASASVTTTTAAAASGSTLSVAKNGGKDMLVDAAGKTVYLYVPDASNTTSQVPSGLKALWPAVTATGASTVGAGLDASKIALQAQPDGSKQVSYNGHLLYTFTNDTAPGDAKGQGLGNIWYTLSASGDANA